MADFGNHETTPPPPLNLDPEEPDMLAESGPENLLAYGLLRSVCIGEAKPNDEDTDLRYTHLTKPVETDPNVLLHETSMTVPGTGEHILVRAWVGQGFEESDPPVQATIWGAHETEQDAIRKGDTVGLSADGTFGGVYAHLSDAPALLERAKETRNRMVVALSSCNLAMR